MSETTSSPAKLKLKIFNPTHYKVAPKPLIGMSTLLFKQLKYKHYIL